MYIYCSVFYTDYALICVAFTLICCCDVDDEMLISVFVYVNVIKCVFGGGMIWLGTTDFFDCVIGTDTCGLV